MESVIDKGSSLELRRQIRNLLAERIETAYYKPGRKIDSIRKLSDEFKVSPVTIGAALRLLEAEDYIIRIPANGVFVNEKFTTAQKQIKVVFAFPEKSISQEILPAESWALSSEIFRGVLDGGMEFQVQVFFEYFQDQADSVQLQHQLKRLRQYDAAIFTGRQLLELQKLYAQTNLAFQFVGENSMPEMPLVGAGYSRHGAMHLLAEHATACNYRTVSVISLTTDSGFYQTRALEFLRICREYGLEAPDHASWEFPVGGMDNERLLREKLSGELPDMIFCNHAEFVQDIYEAAVDCGVRFGLDTGLAGIATGWTFNGLIPSLTYVQVPQYRLAKKLVQEAVEVIRNGKIVNSIIVSDLQLVQGKSTRIK